MTSACSFPKSVRLLCRTDFLAVQNSRHRVVASRVVFFLLKNELGRFRVGFTVSRKFGCAVQRNRIRRRLREAIRSALPLLATFPIDVVVLPRDGVQTADFGDLQSDIGRLVRHLRERSL
ncbi:MAG: ribonuclease P protein component [Deltaproteobacteria bacterium HGW-Deltaproteobacteria-17]|nr:MAG: ribonuclease P protein component [Deltaproteobacteria bacterium HGW-Deltaproteobacteria-17]